MIDVLFMPLIGEPSIRRIEPNALEYARLVGNFVTAIDVPKHSARVYLEEDSEEKQLYINRKASVKYIEITKTPEVLRGNVLFVGYDHLMRDTDVPLSVLEAAEF